MKSIFSTFATALLTVCSATTMAAEIFPSRPITFIFPFLSGGTDVGIRVMGDKFKERTGQPIVIDYKPGANTVVGNQALLRSAPDGYTLAYINPNLGANPAMFIMPYRPEDFLPITQLFASPAVLVTSAQVPARTLPELIAYAKSRPGTQLNFASNSATAKLMMMAMGERTGISYVDVPYKGVPDSLAAIMSGQADFHFATVTIATTNVKSGKLRILAVTAPNRIPELPDTPAIAELLPGFQYMNWAGAATVAKTPKPIVDYLFREITASLKQPDVIKKMTDLGQPPLPSASPEEFAQAVSRDVEFYLRTAKSAGIVPQPM